MSKEKSPAFQYYPRDLLSDENWMVMDWAEKGIYWELVSVCWLEGSIPGDPSRLARLLKLSESAFARYWPQIVPCFTPGRDGRFVHPRLEQERSGQRQRRENSARGGRSAAAKRAVQRSSTTKPAASESVVHLDSTTKSTSTLHLQSSPAPAGTTPPAPLDVDQRARRFCERYGELYPEHRHGAFYRPSPALDFAAARQLCETWADDAHLEAMVLAWLTHDDPKDEFLTGSRTVRKFASRASGYDEQIRRGGGATESGHWATECEREHDPKCTSQGMHRERVEDPEAWERNCRSDVVAQWERIAARKASSGGSGRGMSASHCVVE